MRRLLMLFVMIAVLLLLPASVVYTPVQSAAPVTNVNEATDNLNGVMKARFENMLNHNYLYDSDFLSDRTIIENSIIPLLKNADNERISKDLVLNFIANMYGRTVDENATVYDYAPVEDGKFAVIPRGYSVIKHNIISIKENDGGYTIVSQMKVDPHDSEPSLKTVKTVFVANEGSTFGYNIVSSDIIDSSVGSAV